MGIPSYFSNLIKQYPHIIKKLIKNDMKVNNFFLDSNSIVYDCVRSINFEENLNETTYQKIIKNVIGKLEEYIAIVNPTNLIMISLDGTPPVAKLDQQRQRRYKSSYTTKMLTTETGTKPAAAFDTIEITTGTRFMSELNSKLIAHFNNPKRYGVNKIIVSTSDEAGEGESKIYEYIRSGKEVLPDSTCLVYGLDADLIMLSINNLPVCPNIYLFRETPEFIKSIDSSLEPNANYVMDIPTLANTIMSYMNNDDNKTDAKNNATLSRVYDYIFICFFLGNDFLPHFPAINIRTGGIDKMLNAYKATIGGTKEVLTDGKTIYWKNVRKMVAFLAEREEEYILAETNLRNKHQHIHYPTDTPDQRFTKFNALPTYEREIELYIKPHKSHWQHRYYSALCNLDKDELREKQICTNYLEGLEWTLKYYTTGCPDWRWCYNYNYPPLLSDLIKYIPYFDTTYIKNANTKPVSQLVQLCYVLPKHSLHLLPANVYKRLLEAHPEWYGENYNIIWAYCKYFWESHAQLPEIDINELELFLLGLD
jgi:5'-3' exonuclease